MEYHYAEVGGSKQIKIMESGLSEPDVQSCAKAKLSIPD